MNILFKDLPLLDTTQEALEALGFESPTPIQAKAIPVSIEGNDIIGQAQTGTGKTFAFAIPMIEKMNTNLRVTQGLVLCPTRELAMQVYKEVLKLVKFYSKLNVALIVGGESYEKQFKALKRKPQIVIATPGRAMDHMRRSTLDLSQVQTLALDEADEMLKMGFQEDIETILSELNEERQILLFSATMPQAIKHIARKYQNNPQIIKIESDTLTVDKISQRYFIVKRDDKLALLPRIIDFANSKSTIIFSNTKADVDRIASYLVEEGYLADALHGDIKQRSRSDVMKKFRDKKLQILVGTDVAARGLDVDDVELVINYDLPHEQEVYVHRIGRTGRAGKEGLAYSFVTPRKQHQLKELERYIKTTILFHEIPSHTDIKSHQLDVFKEELKTLINQDVDNHLEKFSDILEDISQEQLINVLLEKVIPKKKRYEGVEVIGPKKTRGSRDEGKSRRKGDYVDYVANIGRNDKMTPPKFLQMMDKSFGIFQKNIGDIKHQNNQTVFGIKKSAVSRLKKNAAIYQGKMIKIKASR